VINIGSGYQKYDLYDSKNKEKNEQNDSFNNSRQSHNNSNSNTPIGHQMHSPISSGLEPSYNKLVGLDNLGNTCYM